jgi:N-acetylglucosaminyldiphosphoundecaprenol N-acetyl-beta-D-mannosaminyltransferase
MKTILGVKIDSITRSVLLSQLEGFLEDGVKHHLVTTNPEFILEAQHNSAFKQVLNTAELSLPDGGGCLVALDYLHKDMHGKSLFQKRVAYIQSLIDVSIKHKKVVVEGAEFERIPGVELIWLLVQQEWMRGRKVYLLGGVDNVASLAARRLQQVNPSLQFRFSNGHVRIADSLSGVGKTASEYDSENRRIIDDINAFAPDVLFVAYGHPWQELWIARNMHLLRVKIAVGVGGSFDFISQRKERAPVWFRNNGLEWVFRLVKEPKRYKRIVNAVWRFSNLVIASF